MLCIFRKAGRIYVGYIRTEGRIYMLGISRKEGRIYVVYI